MPRDTRGKARVDDSGVISGIVHVLKSGGSWVDAPRIKGTRKTLYNRYVRWAGKGIWVKLFQTLASAGGPPGQVLIDSSAVRAHRSAAGGKGGNGPWRSVARGAGARQKSHALTDRFCRPIAFLLSGGKVADCTAGAQILKQMPATRILHAGKGYDSDAIRRQVEETGAMPNIPSKTNRRWKNCFSPMHYRDRDAIERVFCRLKDFGRVATRYDRLAVNFLAAICIAVIVR